MRLQDHPAIRPDDSRALNVDQLTPGWQGPLLEQHAGDEVLLIGTGRRPPASSECVPERPVRWDEAVAQVPGEEPGDGARRVLLESAVPRRHRRGVRWGSQVPAAMNCGDPAPRGAHRGASPAAMDP